jgi:hypothetical protein
MEVMRRRQEASWQPRAVASEEQCVRQAEICWPLGSTCMSALHSPSCAAPRTMRPFGKCSCNVSFGLMRGVVRGHVTSMCQKWQSCAGGKSRIGSPVLWPLKPSRSGRRAGRGLLVPWQHLHASIVFTLMCSAWDSKCGCSVSDIDV